MCIRDSYYRAVFEAVASNNQTILSAEMDLLGVGHEEIGGQLASAWKFSENYTACIEHHHNPTATRRYTRLVYVIHIADCLSVNSSTDLAETVWSPKSAVRSWITFRWVIGVCRF